MEKIHNDAKKILDDDKICFEEKYNKWYSQIDKAARSTIGKTTYKDRYKVKPSEETKRIREKKKELKSSIQSETDKEKKRLLIDNYKQTQEMAKEMHWRA